MTVNGGTLGTMKWDVVCVIGVAADGLVCHRGLYCDIDLNRFSLCSPEILSVGHILHICSFEDSTAVKCSAVMSCEGEAV